MLPLLSGQVENKTIYQKEYQQVGTKNLTGLGEVLIFEHPLNKDKVFAKVFEFNSKEELRQCYSDYIQKQQVTHEYEVKILDLGIIPEDWWSKTVYKLVIFLEYFPNSLFEQISYANAGLDQISSTHLFYQGCKVIQDLQQKYPNDFIVLNTKQIFRCPYQANQFKFLPIVEGQKEKFKSLIRQSLESKDEFFIGPEIHDQYQKGQQKVSLQLKKNTSFVFGLSMLEIILNKNLKFLYKKIGFDWQALDKELKKFEEIFQTNEILVQGIKYLLQENINERTTCMDLMVALPSYDQIKKKIAAQSTAGHTVVYDYTSANRVSYQNQLIKTPVNNQTIVMNSTANNQYMQQASPVIQQRVIWRPETSFVSNKYQTSYWYVYDPVSENYYWQECNTPEPSGQSRVPLYKTVDNSNG